MCACETLSFFPPPNLTSAVGWVSQTPETHIVYLRGWAQDLGVPVLSVNYSLAPESPFPHALDQCYAAYKCTHSCHPVRVC